MTSAYAVLAQVRAVLSAVPDVPHQDVCRSFLQQLKEQQATAIETERVARFHPLRVAKDAILTGFSTLSILTLAVFGRTIADFYADAQQQIARLELPLPHLQDQVSGLLPPLPFLEHAARLPTLTVQDALIVTAGAVALVLVYRVFQGIRSYKQNRLIQKGVESAAHVVPILESAALTENRNRCLIMLADSMHRLARVDETVKK